jgi:serine/threonine protein kinase
MTVRHPNVSLTLDFGEAHGRHYLVREFDEDETLADILARRCKLQPVSAARIFASALQGLQALHEKQVPAGPLGSDCIILAAAGRSPNDKGRLVKILNAGVPRTMFDPNALADSPASTAKRDEPAPGEPKNDLFRLGVLFYRALTGQLPFPSDTAPEAAPRARPISELAPDVPPILAHLVEPLIDPDPAQRPAAASRVAKSLRVFLASEEETQHGHPEDNLVPQHAPVSAPAQEGAVSAQASAAAPAAAAGGGTLTVQLKALWEELRPGQRDLVFLALGAAAVIVLVLLLTLLTGIHFVNLVCLLAGGALSFLVERLLHLREESPHEEPRP